MKNSKNIASIFIFLEVLFGIIGGVLYINNLGPPDQSLNDSIVTTYSVLNGMFFGSTIFFGVISGLLLKRANRLLISVLLSLAMGIGFLLLHALVFSIPLFAFFSLFGFVAGFNIYLFKNLET